MKLVSLFPFTLATSLLFSAGCTVSQPPVTMQDSFALDLLALSNNLNSPYAPGASFTINVIASGSNASTQGWTLTSSNPSVLFLTASSAAASSSSSTSIAYSAKAGSVGQTTLTVQDGSKNVLDSEEVSVVAPTSAAVYSYARILGGETDAQSQVSQLEVAAAGTATMLVRYFAGTTEVTGIGSPAVTGSGASTASMTTSVLAPDRDWLEIGGAQAGSGSVELTLSGSTVTVPVTVVDAAQITSVSLAKQSDASAKNGQSLAVVGRSFDAQGGEVFGASYTWELDGVTLPSPSDEPSDLAMYTFQSGNDDALEALRGTLTSSVTIHALHQAGSPTVQVSSTEAQACAVAGGVGADGKTGRGPFVLAAFAGLLALRRQKRRAPSA